MMNKRLRLAALLCVGATLVGMSLSVALAKLGTRRQLHRAEQMMRDADALRIDDAGLADVLAYGRQFGADVRSSQPNGSCTPADCLVNVYALPSDFLSRHPRLIGLAGEIGSHQFHAHVGMWVKNGKLHSTEKVFFTPSAYGIQVFVSNTVSSPSRLICGTPSYRLHPGFTTRVSQKSGVEMFEYWNDPRHYMPQMALTCVVSFRGCTSVARVVPSLWAQQQADERQEAMNANAALSSADGSCDSGVVPSKQ